MLYITLRYFNVIYSKQTKDQGVKRGMANGNKKKAVTTYLADDMHQEFVDVVQARYGLSDAATLQQLIRTEIQRIRGNNTKEQALVAITQRLDEMQKQLDTIERLLHISLLVTWFRGDHNGILKITAEEMTTFRKELSEYI